MKVPANEIPIKTRPIVPSLLLKMQSCFWRIASLYSAEYLMIAKALSQIAKILNHYDGSASLYSSRVTHF
jgi:hypothetical protein